jgi:hypothetical protein
MKSADTEHLIKELKEHIKQSVDQQIHKVEIFISYLKLNTNMTEWLVSMKQRLLMNVETFPLFPHKEHRKTSPDQPPKIAQKKHQTQSAIHNHRLVLVDQCCPIPTACLLVSFYFSWCDNKKKC